MSRFVDTIRRELREELAIEVEVGEELIRIEHAYSHKRLRFIVHLCRWSRGEPQPLASQQVRWVEPERLVEFPFPAANARIIAALHAWLGRHGDSRSCWPCAAIGLMTTMPQVLCFGEAIVDRLGPPGGDPATDLPVEDCLGARPPMWPAPWPGWARARPCWVDSARTRSGPPSGRSSFTGWGHPGPAVGSRAAQSHGAGAP